MQKMHEMQWYNGEKKEKKKEGWTILLVST